MDNKKKQEKNLHVFENNVKSNKNKRKIHMLLEK